MESGRSNISVLWGKMTREKNLARWECREGGGHSPGSATGEFAPVNEGSEYLISWFNYKGYGTT